MSRTLKMAARGLILIVGCVSFAYTAAGEKTEITGRELAFSTAKGNCLACHQITGDPAAVSSANIGPPLAAMMARFPDRGRLRAQVWDATAFNPNTVMPPFGKHKVLTEDEIDKIVDYIADL